jgi:hypothetical protein
LYMVGSAVMENTVPSLTEREPDADSDWVKTPYPI